MSLLNEKARKIILKRLKLKSLSDVFSREFKDSDVFDPDRERTTVYSSRIRGSVRLRMGKFYTGKEHDKRIARSLNVKLP